MKAFWNRYADRQYRKGGWAPAQTWPVPREGGEPLVFQMRLPLGLELIDIATLAANAPGAPDIVRQGAAAIAQTAAPAGVIVTGALRRPAQDGTAEVIGTVTVAHSDVAGPPDAAALQPDDADQDVRPPQVEQLSAGAVRVTRLRAVTPQEGSEPAPMLTVQYMLQTRFGALTFVWGTTQPELVFSGEGRELFLKITETGYIGTQPKSY